DYLRFLDMAYASSREAECQLSLAHRLGYLNDNANRELSSQAVETAKGRSGLIRSLRRQPSEPTACSLPPPAFLLRLSRPSQRKPFHEVPVTAFAMRERLG